MLFRSIDFQVEGDNYESPIAPLLFVTLIENAFKHGISPNEPSFVKIFLDIRSPEKLIFRTENSYYPKKENDRSGSGIGIDNLRKRISLIYKNNAVFSSQKNGNEFTAQIIINYTKDNERNN